MSLRQYTQILTLGAACSPTFQLRRVAEREALTETVVAGPFDWFAIDLASCRRAITSDFRDFFLPASVTCRGIDRQRYWRLEDAHGVRSRHHVPWCASDAQPSTASWAVFQQWLDERVRRLRRTLASASQHLLAIRVSDPGLPDRAPELAELARELRARAACRVSVAAVFYGAPPVVDDPAVRTFQVARSWPAELSPTELDWGRDYGRGPAWQGDTDSWDRIWSAL